MITIRHIENEVITESYVHNFHAFASDLYDCVPMLRRGFPKEIETKIGNGMPFISEFVSRDDGGDIEFVRYRQAYGCVSLKIFND